MLENIIASRSKYWRSMNIHGCCAILCDVFSSLLNYSVYASISIFIGKLNNRRLLPRVSSYYLNAKYILLDQYKYKRTKDNFHLLFCLYHITSGPIIVDIGTLEVIVYYYVYLSQSIQLVKHNFEEADRRIYYLFEKLSHSFESSIPQSQKTRAFNQCALQVMTYGAET